MSKSGDRGSGIGDRDRDRDRFDTVIDLAVREMLDVEPPAGLRERVLDRIERSTNPLSTKTLSMNPVASAFRRKCGWIALPVAAAAVIVLAVLAPWRHADPPLVPAIAKAAPPVTIPVVEAPQAEAPRTVSIPLPYAMPPSRPRNAQQTVRAAVAPDDAAADVVWIDPLATPTAMAVAPMAPPPAPAVTSIDLAPARIPALEVRPISDTPQERRNQE